MDLRGARALVTGASRGIGAELALAFAAAGTEVVVVGRDRDALGDVARSCGGTPWPADLADTAVVRGLVAAVEAASGPVDVLVNNAGIESAGDFLSQDHDDVEALLRLNLVAPMTLCRAACPGMVARQRGHVVNVSSMAAYSGFPGLAAYGASKAGLTQFHAGLRADLRGSGVGTTLVELGPVVTDMLARIEEYPPSGAGFARMRRLGLLVDVPAAEAAQAIVAAVRAGRRHVRLPRRAAIAGLVAAAPRRATELMLTGRAFRRR